MRHEHHGGPVRVMGVGTDCEYRRPADGPRLRSCDHNRDLRGACRAGILGILSVNWHTLRRTAASSRALAGVDLYRIKEIVRLGHGTRNDAFKDVDMDDLSGCLRILERRIKEVREGVLDAMNALDG